jgi:uncharacterized membrane protein
MLAAGMEVSALVIHSSFGQLLPKSPGYVLQVTPVTPYALFVQTGYNLNTGRFMASTAEDKIDTAVLKHLKRAKLDVIPVERTFTETAIRSAVKAMLWRIIAGSITFATALQFSKALSTALTIVGSDFFSKSFTMFIGERLMNKSKIGRKDGADNVGRSLAKALLWRLFAVTNTLFAAIFISEDLSIASKISGSDAIIKTTLMFLYERSWAKVEWGKD